MRRLSPGEATLRLRLQSAYLSEPGASEVRTTPNSTITALAFTTHLRIMTLARAGRSRPLGVDGTKEAAWLMVAMLFKHLRLIALASALLHLADTGVSALAHNHGAGPFAISQVRPSHAHHGSGCSHRHHQCPPTGDGAGTKQDSSEPLDQHHDCAACRHLCRPLLHLVVIPESVHVDLVCEIAVENDVHCLPTRIAIYHSRAPPIAIV